MRPMKSNTHADGSEEIQPRSEQDIAAIEEANRIAARTNLRVGDRRKIQAPLVPYVILLTPDVVRFGYRRDSGLYCTDERGRKSDPRRIVSEFEHHELISNYWVTGSDLV